MGCRAWGVPGRQREPRSVGCQRPSRPPAPPLPPGAQPSTPSPACSPGPPVCTWGGGGGAPDQAGGPPGSFSLPTWSPGGSACGSAPCPSPAGPQASWGPRGAGAEGAPARRGGRAGGDPLVSGPPGVLPAGDTGSGRPPRPARRPHGAGPGAHGHLLPDEPSDGDGAEPRNRALQPVFPEGREGRAGQGELAAEGGGAGGERGGRREANPEPASSPAG